VDHNEGAHRGTDRRDGGPAHDLRGKEIPRGDQADAKHDQHGHADEEPIRHQGCHRYPEIRRDSGNPVCANGVCAHGARQQHPNQRAHKGQTQHRPEADGGVVVAQQEIPSPCTEESFCQRANQQEDDILRLDLRRDLKQAIQLDPADNQRKEGRRNSETY
jgi:hypothetical protein